MARTAAAIRSDIALLEDFASSYRLYFSVPDEDGSVPVLSGSREALRQKIHRQLGPSERIMQTAGTNGIGVMPPAAIGGPPRQGLAATAFAQEHPIFAAAEPPIHLGVLDAVNLTLGVLEDELKKSGGAVKDAPTPPAIAQPTCRRIPRSLQRLRPHFPKWRAWIVGTIAFLASVAVIVGTLGTIFGWWSG